MAGSSTSAPRDPTPGYLMPFLHERREELNDVVAYGDLTRLDLQWDENLAEERHIEMRSAYPTPGPRRAYLADRTHYQPATVFTEPRRYERDLATRTWASTTCPRRTSAGTCPSAQRSGTTRSPSAAASA